jgi:nucleoprotein TPR
MADQLIKTDNILLDEWIPLLSKQADSLQTVIINNQSSYKTEKEKIQKDSEMYLYVGGGAVALAFILLIIVFLIQGSKKKLKKKKKLLQDTSVECENLKKQISDFQEEIEALKMSSSEANSKLSESEKNNNSLISEITSLRHDIEKNNILLTEISELQSRLQAKDEELNTAREECNILKQESEAARRILESEMDSLKDQINELRNQNQQEPECSGHIEKINELHSLLDREREENISILREKEELLNELRSEIHKMRVSEDEKNREDHYGQFTEVSDIMEENNRLRRLNSEQFEIIEDYRQTLEKELESRIEFEDMLNKFFQK